MVPAASFAWGLCSCPFVRVIPVGTDRSNDCYAIGTRKENQQLGCSLGVWGMKRCLPVTPLHGLLKWQISLNFVNLYFPCYRGQRLEGATGDLGGKSIHDKSCCCRSLLAEVVAGNVTFCVFTNFIYLFMV